MKVVDKPRVLRAQRAAVTEMGSGFFGITLTYGFADEVDVPKDLVTLVREPVCDPVYTTYFLGRETVQSTEVVSGMVRWRERLFALLRRNASSAAVFVTLPHDKVFEIGSPVDF